MTSFSPNARINTDPEIPNPIRSVPVKFEKSKINKASIHGKEFQIKNQKI